MEETFEQEYLRVYKKSFRVMLKHWVLCGQYVTEMHHAKTYAKRRGIKLPLLAPLPGFLDTEDPQSGLCRLIRAAVDVGYLRGNEDWLEPVTWKE